MTVSTGLYDIYIKGEYTCSIYASDYGEALRNFQNTVDIITKAKITDTIEFKYNTEVKK